MSAEEASRPPAVRPSQPSAEEASRRGAARERAANRDVAAAGPLLVIVIPAVLLLVFAVVDPLAPAETPKDPLARAVEQVCAEAAALCEAGNAVRRLVEAKDCEAARDEANRLAATFVRLPDATRTAALERALNVVHEHARECR